MARAIWSGAVGFGLVNIPVRLYGAVDRQDVHFHQFERGTGKRIHNKRVAEGSDEEVAFEDIDKGYEVTKGRFVMVTPEELESVEPGRSKTIDIEDFVDLHEVDPVYFDTTYYVAPADGAEKPYLLLLEALKRTERIAVARFVLRTKQYLAALRPGNDLLLLETMLFPDEIRDPAEVEGVPPKQKLEKREVEMATDLIESLSRDWDPTRYTDTYRSRVLELIERKAKGKEIVVEREEPAGADVLDLMAALEASVRAARQGKRPVEEAPAPSGDDEDGRRSFAGMTKKELEQEARKRGIPGRSAMTRDQLAEALGRAS